MPKPVKGSQDRSGKFFRVPDFLPFACFYDSHTILTKNGEVMQTLKIVGFTHEQVTGRKIGLRAAIRQALQESFGDNSYAIWFHTIRRRKNLDPGGSYPAGFSEYLNKRWGEANQWSEKFTNELYITIVKKGQTGKLEGPKGFLRGLWPPLERDYRLSFLAQAFTELNDTVERMLETLTDFGAQRLGLVDTDGVIYAEALQFLGKIINLEERPRELPLRDLSEYLPDTTLRFDFNTIEVSGPRGNRYGALLTIKDYVDLSATAIDRFLQLPQEFIITQTIDFINRKQALENFSKHKYYVDLSEDTEFAEMSGIDEIVGSNRGTSIDYGEHQISLFLVEDTFQKLEETLERTVQTLGHMGLVPIREDIRLEETFWAQLPGNFEFLKRRNPINTTWVGGFASLHNFPAGRAVGNWWGPAATVFYTNAGTPYFFNFHDETGNGHTTIIGPFGSGKTVLLNFLISEARKFRSRLIVFDRDHASRIFINAIGGTYHTINAADSTLKLNPLLLEDTSENRDFLAVWLSALISGGEQVSPEELSVLRYAVEINYSIPAEHRNLSTLVYYLTQQGYTSTAQKLQRWTSFGEYGRVFDNTEENIGVDHIPILGFEMGLVARNIAVLGPTLLYLLHRINLSLDGYPTMIVLDEAWSLLDNHVFAPFVAPWLENLKKKNTMAILATESVDEASESRISSTIMDHIATQLYLPNPFAGEAYQEVFRLSDEEYMMVTGIQSEKRQFLLKNGQQSVVAVLNLFGMDDLLSVLSANETNIARMERLMAERGPAPEQWLPAFLEEIKQETAPAWATEAA